MGLDDYGLKTFKEDMSKNKKVEAIQYVSLLDFHRDKWK